MDRPEHPAPDWETLAERLIREAHEDGQFDDLPGHGRPLALRDDTLAGDMSLAHHMLHNAGVAPAWIETDKEVRRALDDLEALLARAHRSPASAARRLERELETLTDTHDDAVGRLESLAPTPRQQRRRLDRARLRGRLVAALHGDPRVT